MACLGSLLPIGSLLLLLLSPEARGEYGVVRVVSKNWNKDYCVLYSSDYVTLPRDLSHAPLLPLHDGTKTPWCPDEDSFHQAQDSSLSQRPLHQTTTMVVRGNCSFYAKGWLAQDHGAHGLLIVSRASNQQCSDTTSKPQDPSKPRPALTIPVAVLRYTDMLDILSHTYGDTNVHIAMYAPLEPIIDYNMVIIFILAVGTVAAGGYWAGLMEADRLQRHQARRGGGFGGHNQSQTVSAERSPRAWKEEDYEDAAVDFTPAMTGAVVTMSCSIMVLLYFFYDCFVYIMIGIFGLGASTGLYSCLAPIVRYLPLWQHQWVLPGHRASVKLSLLLLAGLCAMVTVLWVIYRNEDRWAWLLQDTLGVAYCLFVLRRVRLPTLKNCTSFLLALLAFDVFFVFITPLFTKTGESIMVEVASGPVDSSSHERLPMVLKVPRMSFSALTLCDQPFSILGFGDIVVPGFLVAYCHRFDVQIQSRQVYYRACTVAYAMGLLVTFVAMVLMQMGQPALLYLVSSTLLTSLVVATCRQELTLFWTGQGRAKIPAEPVVQPCIVSAVACRMKLEGVKDSRVTNRFEEAIDRESGDLDSNPGDDIAEMVTLSEDEATSPEGHSESSEGWSDTNLDPDELPSGSPMALEELMPLAMLIPLIPPIPHTSELGRIHTQSRVRDSSLPWMGMHKRKGLKVKKSMSTQAPL
ncbi:similar to intramembrane protease 5 (predicted) [Rattus norvegicus]|uniref:Signal peptide peptidase-like 2C n=2 Tax=Rattus norvegicus TaxID=10116 RepID=B1H292_RAT|nr:signal peptide peptidase-like 2C precursor [Rattus norvegicus]AAI60911.1 Intramembrane protease 5 [Rattus norvegicus]EDM06295.1 similar to intramembrane protease 5 (predicted) [Rattus norvegicus]|eukprot:NP_001099317.1 signal peptide peptidase-like 2C precursor [Rattus norvegicus]